MALPTKKEIGRILEGKGFISEDSIREAIELLNKEGIRFGEACMKLGLIDERQLVEALADQYGLEMIDIERVEVDEEALNLIPVEVLHRCKVVPVRHGEATLVVTADPTDILKLDDIERMIEEGGGSVDGVAVGTPTDIERLLTRGGGSRRILREVEEGFDIESLKVGDDEDESILSIEKISEDASPVVKLVDTTIYDAISKRASDIHLESGNEGLTVKYRLDGVLHKVMGPIDRKFQASIVSRVKVMSELDISERRIPQDGRFKIRLKNKTIDFRVSIMPSIHGEDAVIRVLDKEHITREFEHLSLDLLGFGDKEVQHLRRMIHEPYGMLLVTGPTGSGKTTTLYAAISEINTGEDKIVTIEDPVEYELKGIIQIPVNEKKGLTFARGLRSVLRHDPDKIMVGEIRDQETAQIAIQAALTGHLVFTTVHANNVFDVMGRFIHMGIEPYNFVTALNCILAQRLLRLVCPECKTPVDIPPDTLRDSGIDPQNCKDATFYRGKGCGECFNTGYRGRRAVMELLDLSDEIRDMIASKEPISVIKRKAGEEGMVGLRQRAIELVVEGKTTIEEINRVTFVE
ncbi:MAG: ATPase, T2SS/T4P/T4SS family [Thermodesulfobacteriota bacterium]